MWTCIITEKRLFIKPGIQERGTKYEECRERREYSLEFRGTSSRIPGYVIILIFRATSEKIPANVLKDSLKWSRRFRGMFKKIPWNVRQDPGQSLRRFWEMLKKIPGNVKKDSGEFSRRFWGMLKRILVNTFNLKKPRYFILRIVRVWSLFCLIQVYTSLHFLPIPLENYFFYLSAFFVCSACSLWNLCNLYNIFIICMVIVYKVGVRNIVFLFSLVWNNL